VAIKIDITHLIDLQTQGFLREVLRIYTRADLAALTDLKARIERTNARIELIDKHLSKE
jgi:hypothetical protein